MFAIIFGIASLLIDRTFSEQLDKDVEERKTTISNLYRLFVESIRNQVQTTGEDRGVFNAMRTAERGGIRDIPTTDFDVFECGNDEGILVLSNRIDEKHIGYKIHEIAHAETDETFKQGKGTIRERVINLGEEPQLVVEVTQWWDWGFVTGGRSLQKWLEGESLSQPAEHPIFLVRKKDEQEEWIPLNNIAGNRLELKDKWEQQMTVYTAAGKPVEDLVVSLEDIPQQPSTEVPEKDRHSPTYTVVRTDILSTPFFERKQLPFVELIIAYSHDDRILWQDRMRMIILLSVGAGAFLVYISSYLVSRRITRPIAQLQKGVSEIGAGNLTYQLDVRSKGEVGELAEGFNKMAQALMRSLEEHRTAERIAVWRDVARQLAHEVKNPLFPIRLSVENLQAAKDKTEVFDSIFQECTDTIIEEVDRIRGLIDEFHQYARLPVPDRQPVNLNDIVEVVLKLYIKLSQTQKITVEKQLGDLPHLSLDREQMERSVGNIVKNAIEAMPDGGTLTLRTYATPISDKNVSSNTDEQNQSNTISNKGRYISLEVQDTGHGMSEETQKNLFTPDYTTKPYGTGLGMAIVRRIITVHGGEIVVESELKVGTKICITFDEISYLNDTQPALIPLVTKSTPQE